VIDPSIIVPSDPVWSHAQKRTGQRGGHGYSSETPYDEGIPSIILIEGSSIIVIALNSNDFGGEVGRRQNSRQEKDTKAGAHGTSPPALRYRDSDEPLTWRNEKVHPPPE
jgi:hypothetical protein